MAHTQGIDSLDTEYLCHPFTSQPLTSVPNARPKTVMPDFKLSSSPFQVYSEESSDGIHVQTPLLSHLTITSSQLPISVHQVPTFHAYVTPSMGPETAVAQDLTPAPKPPTQAAPTSNLHDVDVAIVTHPSQASRKVKYTKRQLYDLIQVALEVNFFMAQHGEKGATLKAFGNGCRKLRIKGGDSVLKDRMLELLAYHDVRFFLISLNCCSCSILVGSRNRI